MIQNYLSDIVLGVNNIVGMFVVIRFLNHLLTKKNISKMNRRRGILVLLIVATALNIVFVGFEINLFLVLVLNFIIGDLFYQGKKQVKLVIAIFIVVFSFITELLTAILFGSIFGASIQGVRENTMLLFLGGIVSKILLMLLIEVIIRFRRRNASKVYLSSWMLIISIPFMSVVLAVISVYQPVVNNSFSIVGFFVCLSILYINIISFYLFDTIIIQIDENNLIRFREEQLILQQNQYKNIVSGHSQVEKLRHDMIGHFITLDGYLNHNRIEEAKSYIGRLNSEIDFSKHGILSQNIAVDAIINNRKAMARELGIELSIEIMIPQYIDIDDVDICIVLGNALNNAIEACQRMDNDSVKNIHLKVKYKRGLLLIEVKNPYDSKTIKKRNEKFVSSKSYRSNNELGTGIGNIEGVMEKYNGFCEMDLQSDEFIIKVMIPEK